MSSIAVSAGLNSPAGFYQSVIGKKVIMAVTGFMLFGFVVGHMLGNLQIFAPPGPDGVYALDAYAHKLRALGPLLWAVRCGLLAAAILHALMAFQLWRMKGAARPQEYLKKASTVSTYASRTMYWSGPLVLLYIVYHLMQFTWGVRAITPGFEEGRVHHNLVAGFSNPAISLVYIIANVLLAIHLYHGLWSLFQTLGVGHPRYNGWLKNAARVFAVVIGAGFVAVPLGVLTGIVK
jgi:succinate dehydrogenase / fumarate reductase, cytochrome b subunit